jgi:hypothetical protein
MIVIIIVVAFVIAVWLIAGGISQNNAPSATREFEKCTTCRRLDAWWNSQDGFGKFGGALCYGLQKLGCALMGC